MKHTKLNYFLGLFPFLLVLYEFTINLSNDMYTPALPELTRDLHASVSLIQLTVISWFAGSIVVHPVIGVLSDYYGRRRILFTGGLLFLLSTILCMLTANVWVLLIARFFQGLTTATLVVAGYASVHELYEDRAAIHILAWINSATVLAPIVGPIFGGYIVSVMSWRMIFVFIAAAGALILSLLFFVMPEPSVKRAVIEKINIRDIVRDYRSILTNRSFVQGGLIAGVLYGGVVIWIVTSPFFIMNHFGKDAVTFGLLQIPIFTAYIIGAQFIRLLLKFINQEAIILLGTSIAFFSAFALLQLNYFMPANLAWMIVAMCCYCVGFGLVMAPINRICVMVVSQGMGMVTAAFDLLLVTTGTACALVINFIDSENLRVFSVLLCFMMVFAILLNIRRLSSIGGIKAALLNPSE